MTTMISGEVHRKACDGEWTGRSIRASREFNNLVRVLAVSDLRPQSTAGLRIVVED